MSEDEQEREWAVIRTLFAGSRLINADNIKADTKGNEPMDEELFTEETIKRLTEPEGAAPRNSEYDKTLVVDIETYTKHALGLQLAIVEAETNLANAKQKHREAEARVQDASLQWLKAATTLHAARVKLEKHLNIIRKSHVTLRGGPHE